MEMKGDEERTSEIKCRECKYLRVCYGIMTLEEKLECKLFQRKEVTQKQD